MLRSTTTAPPVLDLQALAATPPADRIRGRNKSKATVSFYSLDRLRVAIKSYAGSGFWLRNTLGRWLISREARALATAADVAGIPRLLGRVGSFALATEWIDAQPVAAHSGQPLDNAIFDAAAAILDALHNRGIAHGDLHHRDLLVGPTGRVFIVDLATAWILGPRPSRLRRALFERLAAADRVNLARIRARLTGADEAAAVAAVGPEAAAWHARGRRIKSWLDRLRGKTRHTKRQ